jgi:hypothetical protein
VARTVDAAIVSSAVPYAELAKVGVTPMAEGILVADGSINIELSADSGGDFSDFLIREHPVQPGSKKETLPRAYIIG